MPVARGSLRGGEVEVVGHRQGLSTHAAEVASGLGDGRHAAPLWIESHPAVGAIDDSRHATGRRLGFSLGTQTDHSRIRTARGHHRVGLHLMVVLAVDPALGSDGGVIQQGQERLAPALTVNARRGGRRQLRLGPAPVLLNGCRGLAQQVVAVDRRVIRQGTGGHLSSDRTVLQDPNNVVLQDTADDGRLQAPTGKALHQCRFAAGLHHKEHPLLGFAE